MKPRANALSGSDWLKNSFSIWRGFGRDGDSRGHPASFPVALASKIIECYAGDDDGWVLDPFAGSGSALLAALRCGMRAVGLDVNSDYRSLFQRRLTLLDSHDGNRWSYDVHDARHLSDLLSPNSIELCITSPPYWDILNRKRTADKKRSESYSTNGADLGNIPDYDTFMVALADVAKQVRTVLRPRKYFILNVMDIRKGPRFYALHQDAATAVANSGFVLHDIIIWDRQSDYNSMRPLGYPHKFIINKVHEYLLVFVKEE